MDTLKVHSDMLRRATEAVETGDLPLAIEIIDEVKNAIVEILIDTERADTMRSYDLTPQNDR